MTALLMIASQEVRHADPPDPSHCAISRPRCVEAWLPELSITSQLSARRTRSACRGRARGAGWDANRRTNSAATGASAESAQRIEYSRSRVGAYSIQLTRCTAVTLAAAVTAQVAAVRQRRRDRSKWRASGAVYPHSGQTRTSSPAMSNQQRAQRGRPRARSPISAHAMMALARVRMITVRVNTTRSPSPGSTEAREAGCESLRIGVHVRHRPDSLRSLGRAPGSRSPSAISHRPSDRSNQETRQPSNLPLTYTRRGTRGSCCGCPGTRLPRPRCRCVRGRASGLWRPPRRCASSRRSHR